MAPGPDDVTKTNFEDIKNIDVDHTINKVDLNNDEIKNVDFDKINKIDLSDDIKNVDFDKTINKGDLNSDIKNVDFDKTINKFGLSDDVKNVDFNKTINKTINKLDLNSGDVKNVDFNKTINKLDLNNDDVKSVIFDKTINKIDLNSGDVKNVDFEKTRNKLDLNNDDVKSVIFDKTINKIDLNSGDVKNVDFDKTINKVDLNNDDVKSVIFDKTINKIDLNSGEIKNIEVDDTFKKAGLGNGIKNVDLENIKNTLDKDNAGLDNKIKNTLDKDNSDLGTIKNTLDKDNADIDNTIKNVDLDKDNADLSAPNTAGAPAAPQISAAAAPPSVGAPAAPAPAAKTPSFLSRAWSQIKDAGSRAYDAISSIPDRIRAQFSSSQPPPAAQAVAPAVPAAPAAPATPALGKDGVGLEQTPQQLGVQTPAPGRAPGDHVGVRFGSDEAHLTPKGQGLQTSGILERVEHKDGVAVVHFKAGAHEQVLAVDEKSPSGKAVAEALDHIKPGEEMTMKIGHDQRRNDTIEIADKTSGFTAHVQDGKLDAGQNMPGKGQEPKLGR
jgi:hypothetical protein